MGAISSTDGQYLVQLFDRLVDILLICWAQSREISFASRPVSSTKMTRARDIANMLNRVRETEACLGEKPTPTVAKPRCHEICLLIIDTENMEGISFADITGPVPYTSIRGYCYIFFLYSYDANTILMELMQCHDDGKMTRAYTMLYAQLEAVGIKPKINKMDDEASRATKTWLTKENTAYYTCAPSDGGHRTNRAECAIQTGTNHIVSTIAITDPDFLIRYWCYGIEQMEMTMNMLRRTHINPEILAFTYTHGQFSYDEVPVLPVVWKMVCFEDPANQQT